MISDVAAARFAANAYATSGDVTSRQNEIAIPAGWNPIDDGRNNPGSGFLARAYTDGTQVVIAFGGTTGESASQLQNFVRDWLQGNLPAAGGVVLAPQVLEAAKFYLDVTSDPQYSGMPVTFTGHSLGGGLAALMAVFFDKPAVTFDAAPFLRHADSLAVVTQLKGRLLVAGYSLPAALAGYVAVDPTGAVLPSPSRLLRDDQVHQIYVTGEALSMVPAPLLAALGLVNPFVPTGKIIGTERPLDPQAQTAPGWGLVDRALNLHSQTLLTGFLASTAFLDAAGLQVGLLPAIFGSDLMTERLPNRTAPRLLETLVNRQLAGRGSLDVLAQDVVLVMSSGTAGVPEVNAALYAAALGAQFVQPNQAAAQREFAALAGGVQFLLKDSGDLDDARRRLHDAAVSMVGLDDQNGLLTSLRRGEWRWTVQSGDGALAASGADGKGDAMLGGENGDSLAGAGGADILIGAGGTDTLDGGASYDKLFGGAGDDTLIGGAGSDYLLGGTGNDTYVFEPGHLDDAIIDADGAGQIVLRNGSTDTPLTGGKMVTDNTWLSDEINGVRYGLTKTEIKDETGAVIRTDLIITKGSSLDRITIRDWQPGRLGITLSDTPAPFAATEAQQTAPTGTEPYWLAGDTGGTGTRDELTASGGNDLLHGFLGDDLLQGGDNGDILVGGLGADRITGGAGTDAIHGGGHLPGVSRGSAQPPTSQTFVWLNDGPDWYAGLTTEGTLSSGGALFGYTAETGGANDADAGDFIDAGDDADWVYGDAGNDVIDLGAGDDIANGGQGSDVIVGGSGSDKIMGDYINSDVYVYLPSEHGNDVLLGDAGADHIEGDGGDDEIYGGADDDVLWGDDTYGLPPAYHGNDTLDGGSGNDQLIGQGGDDELYGGTGNDVLIGDDTATRLAGEFHGADTLDGEDEDDELQGQGGADTLFGGSGNDTLFGDDITSRLAGQFHGADYLDGEDGEDYLEGQGGADTLFGGGDTDTLFGDGVAANVDPAFHGDDYLDGEAGNDFLIGGGGADTLFGGIGNDQLQGDDVDANVPSSAHGNDYLDGEDGDDVLAGQGGADTLYGGEGNDTLLGDAIESQVAASVHGDDYLDGGAGVDTLIGGGGNDVLAGGEGNDSLNGDDVVANLAATAHGDDTLYGDGGDDLLVGAGGNDYLSGGTGNDTLRGDGAGLEESAHGADVLDGGDGIDLLIGEGGADILIGGADGDALWGDGSTTIEISDAAGGDDELDGGDGNDGLVGGAGADTLRGGAGNDGLYGDGYVGTNGTLTVAVQFQGADTLDGGDGDDYLDAGGGDDVLLGGTGTDTLRGGAGADRYVFAIGDSGKGVLADAISDAEGVSTISFASDISAASLDFASSGFGPGQLLTDRFTFGPNREEIVIGDLFANASFELEFADGQRMSLQRLLGTAYYGSVDLTLTAAGSLLSGGAAGDRLQVSGGGSTVFAGQGDDLVTLRGGDNRHVFHRGDGRDRLTSEGTVAQPDRIVLKDSILPAEVALTKTGNDLRIGIGTALDEVLVVDYYLGGVSIRIEFEDGSSLGTTEIAAVTGVTPPPTRQINISELGGSVFLGGGDDFAVGKGGADTIYGGGGNDTIEGGAGDDFLEGEAGNDLLVGGQGFDRLRGGAGADVYEFSAGDGLDMVYLEASPPAGQADRIRMRGIAPAQAMVYRIPAEYFGYASTSADFAVLTTSSGSNEIGIPNFFDPAIKAGLATVEFDDGTQWTAADLESRAVSIVGTENQLQGSSADDVFVLDHYRDRVVEAANAGTDTVHTPFGYTSDPNVERVELTGLLSNPVSGNDLPNLLTGNGGANRLYGGPGNDVIDEMHGGPGDDTYVLKYYEGNDLIVEAADAGIDTVLSERNITLPANVENLTVQSFGFMQYSGEWFGGNELDNRIDARAAMGPIYIDGGAGADVMIGGSYKTTFYVDDPKDVVIKVAGSSYNRVNASISFELPAGFKDLYLQGAGTHHGIGNESDNTLSGVGNPQANMLRGGAGNDTYVLGAGDMAVEMPAGGVDKAIVAYAAASFSIADFPNVEELWLADGALAADLVGGSGDDSLAGNGWSNTIEGGAGNDSLLDVGNVSIETSQPWPDDGDSDLLIGGAGDDWLVSNRGNDILEGGTGNDTLYLRAGTGATEIQFAPGHGVDRIERLAGTGTPVAATVILAAGFDVEAAAFRPAGNDLRVEFDGMADALVLGYYFNSLNNWYANPTVGLKFADGMWLSPGNIAVAAADADPATGAGNDYVRGTSGIDSLEGLGGDDLIVLGSGDDAADGGDGNDRIWGNAGDDRLDGSAGDDRLDGGDGNDLLFAGEGDDSLFGGSGNDTLRAGLGSNDLFGGTGDDRYEFERDFHVASINNTSTWLADPSEASGDGLDEICFDASISTADVQLRGDDSSLEVSIASTASWIFVYNFSQTIGDASGSVDRIRFADGTVWDHAELISRSRTIYGTDGADVLAASGSFGVQMYGLQGNDSLTGADGDDLLDGGAGADTMRGGLGNDTYVVDSSSDVVTESSNQGSDTVSSAVTYTLGTNVENLTLIGSSAINGTGNSLNNVLIGNDANNTLSGGAGADTMSGGAGNDTYVVDNAGDVVIEYFNEGTDLVQSSVSYTLSANVENLTLTGSSGLSGTGNALDNVLTGNSGANTLTGGDGSDTLNGGTGNDTMLGGAGNDTYVVNATGDVVTESADEGTDTIQSSVTYTLGNNVENLTLTGSSAINATGNALDNVLIGNSGNNTLTGNGGNDYLDGGSGSDTMRGGTGDDTYVVNVSTDVVTENASEGTDTVQSSVTLTLATNVEHLTLTGTSAINGTGNTLANHIRGNGANNTLNGAGGNDVLQGAAGNDTLTDTSGNNLLDGGDGTDSLNGGTGREFIAGGTGTDTLKLGGGADIVAFNRGHGADSVTAPTSGAGLNETNDTVSLGGVRYAELRLARSGNDLFIKVAGTTDSLKFTSWYAASGNRTTTTLQLIVDSTADYDGGSADQLVNRRVVRLNFTTLVNAFNTVYAGNPSIGDWAIPTATLNSAFIAGSDSQALGGDLAYRYGRDGNFSALDFATATTVLADANFATAAQTFSADPTTGGVRLLGVGNAAADEPELGTKRRQVEAIELSESWAAGWAEAGADASMAYLTIDMLDAAAGTDFTGESWPALDSNATVQAADETGVPADEPVTVGGSAPVATLAQRWLEIDAALAQMAIGAAPALGGEMYEAGASIDAQFGLNVLAVPAPTRLRQSAYQQLR